MGRQQVVLVLSKGLHLGNICQHFTGLRLHPGHDRSYVGISVITMWVISSPSCE